MKKTAIILIICILFTIMGSSIVTAFECHLCKGSGNCVACGGDGDRGGQICGSCYGSGDCKYCYGTGEVDYGNTGNQENNPESEYTPGFDILIVLFAISLIFFLKRKSRI